MAAKPAPKPRDLLCLDVQSAERIRRKLPSDDVLTRGASAARALADPARLAIALALAHAETVCVGDLAWIIERDVQTASYHARQLQAAGLARSQRNHKVVMYELTAEGRALVSAVTGEATTPPPE